LSPASAESTHQASLCYFKRIVGALTGVIVSGACAQIQSRGNFRKLWYVRPKLRITAIAGEPEAKTQARFVAEAIRIVSAFLLEQGR